MEIQSWKFAKSIIHILYINDLSLYITPLPSYVATVYIVSDCFTKVIYKTNVSSLLL